MPSTEVESGPIPPSCRLFTPAFCSKFSIFLTKWGWAGAGMRYSPCTADFVLCSPDQLPVSHPGYRESAASTLLGDIWLLVGGFCARYAPQHCWQPQKLSVIPGFAFKFDRCPRSVPSLKLDAWGLRLCTRPLEWFPIEALMDDGLRPMARYGHSLTSISRTEVLLAGGTVLFLRSCGGFHPGS